jgi:CHAD domain-containing protein
MTEHAMEREAKFDVADDFQKSQLGRVTDASTVKLVARYWDTPDHRLLRWGHTLRHRQASDGSEDGWTLKLGAPPEPSGGTGAVLDREEINEPGPPDAPPAGLSALIVGIVRGASVRPIATIETLRDVELLATDGASSSSVEVSDDRVTSVIDNKPGPTFRQIEIEMQGAGSEDLLTEVSERLIRAGAAATSSTKLERVLGRRAEPEVDVPALRRGSRLDALTRYAFARSVVALMRHDPTIRASRDPETVHDARVATRRLRSDLKTLEPILDQVERFRVELRWLGELLGGVRDLDVLIERVQARVRELPEHDRRGSAPILAALRNDRRRRHLRLLDGLRSARYLDLLDDLIEAGRRPPLQRPWDAQRRARPVLRKVIRTAWRRTARAVDRLGDAPSHIALHEIRKRSKRARYAAELGRDVFGKPAGRLADRLADVQDALGALQDTVVAEERLRSLRLASESVFVAGMLVCRERDERADARRRWPRRWTAASKKRLRRWLA